MTLTDALRAEVAKARTHPPLVAAILATIVLTLAFCVLDARPDLGLSTPQTAGVYAMANLSFFAAVVGVLIASSEYGGGQLTASVLAVPRRGRILVAKLMVSATVTTMLGILLAVFVATIVQAPLGEHSVHATGTSGTLLRSLALATCSWTAIGVIGTCAAVAFRSQTAVLTGMIALSFGGTPLMMAVPVFQYLPTNAGVLMFIDRPNQTSDWLNPPDVSVPVAGITLAVWCVAAVAAAAASLARRDIGARHAVSV